MKKKPERKEKHSPFKEPVLKQNYQGPFLDRINSLREDIYSVGSPRKQRRVPITRGDKGERIEP